jgi:hypothetical protein
MSDMSDAVGAVSGQEGRQHFFFVNKKEAKKTLIF